MYFAIGWPQTLNTAHDVQQIVPSSDQSLFVFLSHDSLSLWFHRPVVQIVKYQRSDNSLQQHGFNVSAVWKSDSSQIALQTSQDFLLFYSVSLNTDVDSILNIHDSLSTKSNDNELSASKIPSLVLKLEKTVHVSDGISCIMSAEEEMVISTRASTLCGVEWNGQMDKQFVLNTLLPQSHYPKKEETPCFVIDFKYSTIIGGFALVFGNGFGAFLPLNVNSSCYNQLQLITQAESAICTSINHKYALIVFGLKSSIGLICAYEEIDRRFIVSQRLMLPTNVYPDAHQFLGAMNVMQWTPDSNVIATAWENGGFALWSVFGSLLMCSLSWSSSALDNDSKLFSDNLFKVSSFAFGKEGFHLWMCTRSIDQHDNNNQNVCKLSLAKSVLTSNPCSAVSCETVLLASEDKLLVGGHRTSTLITQSNIEPSSLVDIENVDAKLSNLSELDSNIDSFQWLTIPMPPSYLEYNWPIRYFAIDCITSQNLAITGLNGLAIYSLLQRRWKLFGNENHERDFIVTGGFLWFHEYLICGCYNLMQDRFEIRAYSHRNKLDNSYAKIVPIEKDVHLLSLHHNRLLALCTNGSIFLFDLHLFKKNHHSSLHEVSYELNISSPIEVIVNNMDIYPDCVTMCLLTDLHADVYNSSHVFQSDSANRNQLLHSVAALHSHSILINVCGRLILLEMDVDTTGLPVSSSDDEDVTPMANGMSNNKQPVKVNGDHETNTISYRKVLKLASNVENLWLLPYDDMQANAFRSNLVALSNGGRVPQLRPHLTTSLYLSCGVHGMHIWLSLEHLIRSLYPNGTNKVEQDEHAYISKRIMLPIYEMANHIYPLAVRFREAIVLGAESDFINPDSLHMSIVDSHNRMDSSLKIPFTIVKRTSQVYLHYILRELLRKNLGYRAWEIANTCTALPHFVHSLELLLHGVLEEEASSSQPIPDALLPRVVEFIRAFPVFLKTVIHCTRKTELALWPHLFSIVGSPKDLFQQCISEGQLETAASYIIVLQNLEKPEVATKCASRLLQAARIAGCWTTVKELKRFLRATNHAEQSEREPSNQTRKSPELMPGEEHSTTSELAGRSTSMSESLKNETIDNQRAKLSSPPPQTSKIIPGAAIKENSSDHASDTSEEALIVEEGDKDEECLNSESDSLKDNNLEVTEIITSSGNNDDHKNVAQRAYPGSIMRLHEDRRLLYDSSIAPVCKNKLIVSSLSSVSSISSVSSSTISSASVTPPATFDRFKVEVAPRAAKSNDHQLRQPLNVVSLRADDREQCIIT